MKNIKNYSVKFYHIFVVFLFVSLSFQWGFAQTTTSGNIKLYFETVEKTKAEMDAILANDSLIYLQVYAKLSPEFTDELMLNINFGASTFNWALCNEAGELASSASENVILLGNENCPQGDQDPPTSGRGAATYTFASHGCPTYGHFAELAPAGFYSSYLATPSTHIVKMGVIGFKLLSSDGFFVKMASTGERIDQSTVKVIFNINYKGKSLGWGGAASDWGQAGPDRFDISQVGGVVVKKGFKNKSV